MAETRAARTTSPEPSTIGALRFPLMVWGVWRICQAVLLRVAGGDLADDVFGFDGGWYRSILEHGYSVTDPSFVTQQNVAFFPGLVWLTEPFSWVIGERSAAILVTNLTGATAFVCVFLAIRAVTGNEIIARRSVVALAVWPASIVMTAFYSEGLFITLTALAIWAERRDQHGIGLVAACLAAFTRSVGFLLGPVLAVLRVFRLGRVDRVAVMYAVSGPLGLGLVAAVQGATTGHPFGWASAQSEGWDRGLSGPWLPVYRAVDGIIGKFPSPAMELSLNLAAIILVAVALLALSRRYLAEKSARPFLAWGWVAWLAPLFASLPASQVRYAMAAWPALAVVGDSDSRWVRRTLGAAALVSMAVSVALIRRWASGEFIA